MAGQFEQLGPGLQIESSGFESWLRTLCRVVPLSAQLFKLVLVGTG